MMSKGWRRIAGGCGDGGGVVRAPTACWCRACGVGSYGGLAAAWDDAHEVASVSHSTDAAWDGGTHQHKYSQLPLLSLSMRTASPLVTGQGTTHRTAVVGCPVTFRRALLHAVPMSCRAFLKPMGMFHIVSSQTHDLTRCTVLCRPSCLLGRPGTALRACPYHALGRGIRTQARECRCNF